MLKNIPQIGETLTKFILESCKTTELNGGILDLVASVLLKDRRKDKTLFKIVFSSKEEMDADVLFYSGKNKTGDWREVKDLDLLARQNKISLKFFINTEKKKILVEGCGCFDRAEDYIFTAAIFPRLCPWFFETKPLDEEERKLLSLFFGNDPAEVTNWFKNWANNNGYKQKATIIFANEITDFFLRQSEGTARETVRFCRETKEAALKSYLTACDRLKEAQIRLNGILCGQKHNSEELLQYLLQHDNIEITTVNQSGFNVVIRGYLTIVDSEITQRYCENDQSFFFTRTDSNKILFNDENKKKLIMNLWGPEAIFRLKVFGMFEITDRCIYAPSHRQNPEGYENFVQNPHLYNFGCLGDNEPFATEAVRNGDVQGALEILTAAVCSMNIAESPTVIALLNQLFTEDRKCIEYNGKLLTPKEALKV